MAQLFEKVDLRGEAELLKIQRLLDDALAARLQEAGNELTQEDRRALQATSADFAAQLRQFVVIAEEGEEGCAPCGTATQRTQPSPALRSPLLRPLSPPPADAEVARLEQEVSAASLRVADMRVGMQARLQDMLAAKLAACRPSPDLEPTATSPAAAADKLARDAPAAPCQQAETAEGQAVGEAWQAAAAAAAQSAAGQRALADGGAEGCEAEAEPPLSPRAADLQARLLHAANRMPALRARLEQAADKLQRVVAAVAADAARPPPNTVEKAVLGRTPGRAEAPAPGAENAGGVSPLVQQALESGQISTRRRAARDGPAPPYNQPE